MEDIALGWSPNQTYLFTVQAVVLVSKYIANMLNNYANVTAANSLVQV